MINICFSRTIICLLFIMFAFPRIVAASDELPLKASEQWRKDLKRLVILSRIVADKPSLLSQKLSTKQIHELSAEPFGCLSPDLNECLLSQIAVVLLQITTDTANIFDTTQGAVHITFGRATDVWPDKYISNNWDIVKKWTDIAGPAAVVLGAIMLSQHKYRDVNRLGVAIVGSGAALILVGDLGAIGQTFGGVSNKQRAQAARNTINALQDIETSRQANEDSQLIYGFLDSYSNKSNKLLNTILSLSNDANALNNVAPSPAKSKSIVELCDKTRDALSSFRETAGFVDSYADQLLNLYAKYKDEISQPEDKKKFADAQQSLAKFKDNYNEVIVPLLQGVPEAIEAMENIKAAFIANSIADKQYF